MSPDEAREAILFHSGQHSVIESPRWTTGFLGSLRPYSGLREENLREVMEALRTLAPALQADAVPRDVVGGLFAICYLGRSWGLHPDGMLRRNRLITEGDVERLDEWIWMISYATMCVLDGSVEEAFHEYDREYGRGDEAGRG